MKRALTLIVGALVLAVSHGAELEFYDRPVEECNVRGGAGHALEKLRHGGKFTVAYFGGSITSAGEGVKGWRTRTTKWLRETYPQTQIHEVDATIGGTGSVLGAYRLEHDVLRFKPDLLFVEFSCNDVESTTHDARRAMETIVRRTWERNPFTDIVFAYTITVRMTNDYAKARCHRPLLAHEEIADRYAIPSVNFGPRVMRLLKDGRLLMRASDGVHPRAEGHALHLESLTNLFVRAEMTNKCDHVSKLGTALFPVGNMFRAKMVPVTADQCEGTWREVRPEDPLFGRFLVRAGKMRVTETPGSRLRFRYVGDSCALYLLKGPTGGRIGISVDGGPVRKVDLFDSDCTYWRVCTVLVCRRPGLHDVTVTLDEEQPDRKAVFRRATTPAARTALEKSIAAGNCIGHVLAVASVLVNGELLADPAPQERAPRTVANDFLKLDFHPDTAAFDVTDKRTGRVWRMLADEGNLAFESISAVDVLGNSVEFVGRARGVSHPVRVALSLADAAVTVRLGSERTGMFGEKGVRRLEYPYPFALEKGERTLLPHGCGYAFPAEMEWYGPNYPEKMSFYSRDLKMGMWAVYGQKIASDGEVLGASAFLAVLETPANAEGRHAFRSNGQREFSAVWIPDLDTWGHDREIRYEFFEVADPMSLAKRYRQILRGRGYLRTFAEKAQAHPKMKELYRRLGGAPSVWYWAINGDKAGVCRHLREACGFRDFLFQFARRPDLGVDVTPEEVAACAKAAPGVLLSEYDIYQNTMESKYLPEIDAVRPYWIPAIADNDDVVRRKDGTVARGWRVDMKDKSKPGIGCAIPCDRQVIPYARKRLAAELARNPDYNARYLDVIGCSPPSECWHPRHVVGRRESVTHRRELMAILGDEFGVLSATEDGEEYLADVCDYQTCGFSAPNHYRVDGGRWMWKIYDEDPPESIVFGTDESLRVPFWEMVFHGCNVSYWDWCDYNQKFPKIWWKRDLLNAVSATPPLYFFTPETWRRFRNELAKSHEISTTIARATVFAEMTAYRFLSPDRRVQRSEFSNGVACTVNFGEKAFTMRDGHVVPPHGYRFENAEGQASGE